MGSLQQKSIKRRPSAKVNLQRLRLLGSSPRHLERVICIWTDRTDTHRRTCHRHVFRTHRGDHARARSRSPRGRSAGDCALGPPRQPLQTNPFCYLSTGSCPILCLRVRNTGAAVCGNVGKPIFFSKSLIFVPEGCFLIKKLNFSLKGGFLIWFSYFRRPPEVVPPQCELLAPPIGRASRHCIKHNIRIC